MLLAKREMSETEEDDNGEHFYFEKVVRFSAVEPNCRTQRIF